MSEYKFDAFISYRHLEPDQTIAKRIHKELENFKLPKNVAKKQVEEGKRTKVSRVFRDQEELPLAQNLEDPIIEALKGSDWLIVICSSRLKESEWCRKEIETFIELHGHDHILAVLAEGEPEDSFPEEILHRVTAATKDLPKEEQILEKIEPLAADFRENNKKNYNIEILRLLAPMFELDFDDLRQRHKEQKQKRVIRWAIIIATLSIAFGAYCFYTMLQISRQNAMIAEQSEQIQKQMAEIFDMAMDLEEKNDVLSLSQAKSIAEDSLRELADDNREQAVELAVMSLTEYQGIQMPYSDEGRYALFQSVYPYQFDLSYMQDLKFSTKGKISNIWLSTDESRLVSWDETGALLFWDTKDKNIVSEQNVNSITNADFISENQFCYIDHGALILVDAKTGSELKVLDDRNYAGVYVSTNDVVVDSLNGFDWSITIFDKDTMEERKSFPVDYNISEIYNLDDNYCLCTTMDVSTFGHGIYLINKKTGKSTFIAESDEIYLIKDVIYDGQKTYILYSERTIVDNYDDFNELFETGETDHIMAVDVDSCQVKWNVKFSSMGISELDFFQEDESEWLVTFAYGEIRLMDKETGESIESQELEENNYLAHEIRNGIIMIYTKNGQFAAYPPNIGYILYYPERWLYNRGETIKQLKVSSDALYVVSYNSNSIYRYASKTSENVCESTDEIVYPEQFKYRKLGSEGETFSDFEEKTGMQLNDLVDTAIYVPSEDFVLLDDITGVVTLYKISTKEPIASLDIPNDINLYLGKDQEGNLYFSNGNHGYCISKDYNVIGDIYALTGLDEDNNKLRLSYYSSSYEAPIYTVDELLQMVEN